MILLLKFPLQDTLGGAEFHTLRLALHFQEIGQKILLISSDKNLLKLFRDHNLTCEYLFIGWEPTGKWSVFLWPLTYMIAKYRLKKALRKIQNIEAVFMQSLTEKLALTKTLQPTSHNLQAKIFWLEHKIPGRWLKLNPLKFRYLKLSKQARIVTVSNFAKQEFVKLGVANDNIQAVYPGIKSQNSTFNIPHSIFTIGILSRLHPEKGVLEFLKTISSALKQHPNWRVLIAGEGPEKEPIDNYITHNQLSKQIQLLGFINDKQKIFSQISVLCCPTKVPESFGMSVLEAQASGIPVIASDIGALPEILAGGGFLIKSPEQWTEYLEKLTDSDFRKKTSAAALMNAQRFNPELEFKRFDRLLERS